MKKSDGKETKDDKSSTKIADDKAKPDKDVDVANEKIQAEEHYQSIIKDAKGKGEEKPLSDAVKGDTKAVSVDKEKQRKEEQKETKGDKKGVDEVKADKKIDDSPEKEAKITKPQVDNKETKNSDSKETKDDKSFTKITNDNAKPGKDVEVANEKIQVEEKLTKSVKGEQGKGRERPSSDAVKGDTKAESVDEDKQKTHLLKDTKDDKKGVAEVKADKKVKDSPEKEASMTKPQVDNKKMKKSDDKESKDDKSSTKIANDKAKPDKDVQLVNEKIQGEEKLSQSVKDEKVKGQESPLTDAVKVVTKAESFDKEKQQEDEQKVTKRDKKGVDEVKADKKVDDSPEKEAITTKPQVDNEEMKKSDGKETKDDKSPTKIADDKAKPDKDVKVANEKIHAEEKLSNPSLQVERVAEFTKDDEAKTEDTEDKKKSPGKDVGTEKADKPEAPADDEAAKTLKAFATPHVAKGKISDGKEEKGGKDFLASEKVGETKTQADEKDKAKNSDGKVNKDDNHKSNKKAIAKTEKKVSNNPKVAEKPAEMARRDVEKKSSLRSKKGATTVKMTTSLRASGRLV
jgi:hypothetical protein